MGRARKRARVRAQAHGTRRRAGGTLQAALLWIALGTAISILVLGAPPAAADLVAEGDPAFRDLVDEALDDLREADPSCRALIEALEDSDHEHKIRRRSAQGGSNSPDDVTDAGDGTGTGSTTRWNPDSDARYDNDVLRDPLAVLKHELQHALDADQGVRDPSIDPDTGIKRNEIKAVRTENVYRHATGLLERMTYGPNLLPNCVETECSGSQCDLTFRSCFDETTCVITHRMINNQVVFNSCFAIDEIPFSGNDLEDKDDGDDGHIAQNRITSVADAEVERGILCCGDDIGGAATCETCNEQRCAAKFWEETADKTDDDTSSSLRTLDDDTWLVCRSRRTTMGPGKFQVTYTCSNRGTAARAVTWDGTPVRGVLLEPGASVTRSTPWLRATRIVDADLVARLGTVEVTGTSRVIVPLVDCNGNGVADEVDLAEGTSQDVNGSGRPDECEIGVVFGRLRGVAAGGDVTVIIEGFSANCAIVVPTTAGDSPATVAAAIAAAVNADPCATGQGISAVADGDAVTVTGFTLNHLNTRLQVDDAGLMHSVPIPILGPTGLLALVVVLLLAGLFLLRRLGG